jgi:hypothetical protein
LDIGDNTGVIDVAGMIHSQVFGNLSNRGIGAGIRRHCGGGDVSVGGESLKESITVASFYFS